MEMSQRFGYRNTSIRRLKVLWALAISWMVFSNYISANSPDLYTITGVMVDVTAGSSKEAQELAMIQGRKKAFETLLTRMYPEGIANTFADDDIESALIGVEIERQKNSAVRYIASLTFRFNQSSIRSLMGDAVVDRAELVTSSSGPMVVVPVQVNEQGTPILWDGNSWWKAWLNKGKVGEKVSLMSPLGDLQDMQYISPEQATQIDTEALALLARRYGAGGTVVTHMRVMKEAGKTTIYLDATRVGLDGKATTFEIEPIIIDGDIDQGAYDKMILSVVNALESGRSGEASQNAGAPVSGVETPYNIFVHVDALQQWIQLKKFLEHHPQVRGLKVHRIAPQNADITVMYVGDGLAFESALGAKGYSLRRMENDRWMILPDRAQY